MQEGLAAGWVGGRDEPGAVAGAAGFLHLDCAGAATSIILRSQFQFGELYCYLDVECIIDLPANLLGNK